VQDSFTGQEAYSEANADQNAVNANAGSSAAGSSAAALGAAAAGTMSARGARSARL
jgi:hypothetical protein